MVKDNVCVGEIMYAVKYTPFNPCIPKEIKRNRDDFFGMFL